MLVHAYNSNLSPQAVHRAVRKHLSQDNSWALSNLSVAWIEQGDHLTALLKKESILADPYDRFTLVTTRSVVETERYLYTCEVELVPDEPLPTFACLEVGDEVFKEHHFEDLLYDFCDGIAIFEDARSRCGDSLMFRQQARRRDVVRQFMVFNKDFNLESDQAQAIFLEDSEHTTLVLSRYKTDCCLCMVFTTRPVAQWDVLGEGGSVDFWASQLKG